MFRVICFVEDKNLGELFKRLSGIALNLQHAYVPNLEAAEPVGERTKKSVAAGKTVRVKRQMGNTVEVLVHDMAKLKRPATGAEVRAIIANIGLSPGSYSYFLRKAIYQGLVMRIDNEQGRATYEVK